MAKPTSFASFTVADNTLKNSGEPETGSFEGAIATQTPSNVAATVTAIGNFITAMAGLCIGNVLKDELIYARAKPNTGAASDPLAQRENKWLCRYHDNTNLLKFRMSIPCADLSKHMTNSEFVDLSTGAGASFKTAFEALYVSPDDPSHAITLDSMQFVGRNT